MDVDRENESSESPPPLPEDRPGRPWGFWPTCGFGLLACLAFVAVQVVVSFGFLFFLAPQMSEGDLVRYLETIDQDGTFFAVCTIATGILCPVPIILFARIRKGISLPDYLALKWPTSQELS
ncbi:MAG: hypothetical protein ACPGVU_25865 [Limisphaerales bacterium]